mgnify:CR=1 FL=1
MISLMVKLLSLIKRKGIRVLKIKEAVYIKQPLTLKI